MRARHLGGGPHRQGVGAACRSTLARRVALALATASVGALALAAPALADTTIGQTGGAANIRCASAGVEADTTYVVPPGGGTITSFSFQSVAANAGAQLDFLVLEATGGTGYTVIGTSGPVTLAGTGADETFAADIPVQGGEILGFWNPGLTACVRFVGSGGGEIGTQAPLTVDPSAGDALSLPGAIPQFSVNESANLVTTPTPTPTIDSAPHRYTNQTSLSFAFSSPVATVTFQCRLDAAGVRGPWQSCSSPKSYSGLAEGDYVFRVRAVDQANDHSKAASRTITVDTTAPTPSIDSGPSGTTSDTTAEFTFSSNEPNSRFICSLDSNPVDGHCTSPETYLELAPGRHRFHLRAVDRAGNRSPRVTRAWTIAGQ